MKKILKPGLTAFFCFCVILSQPLLGQGNVRVTLTNRGDVTILGDRSSNSIAIYPVDSPEDGFVIEGFFGTTITLFEPGALPSTGESFFFSRSELNVVRNFSIDLNSGNNLAEIEFLPQTILGNLDITLNQGVNIIDLDVIDPTDIFGTFNVRGSRTGNNSEVLIMAPNNAIRARQATFDMGGNNSLLDILGLQTDRGFNATMRGNNSAVVAGEMLVSGQTNITLRGSFNTFYDVYACDLFGRTVIQARGNNGSGILEDNRFYGDVAVTVGTSNNQLEVCFNDFLSFRASRFQAGRGSNLLLESGNIFEATPVVRGFTVEGK
jgi:hypothetical protein